MVMGAGDGKTKTCVASKDDERDFVVEITAELPVSMVSVATATGVIDPPLLWPVTSEKSVV
jgi:hypothetical protein